MTIHLDPQRQKEAVVAGFLACEEALRDHVEAYVNVMAEWNPVAVCDDDKVIGVLTSKDNIVHLAIIPEYRGRWASRRIIRDMLKYGTETTPGEDNTFVERIGFRRAGNIYKYGG